MCIYTLSTDGLQSCLALIVQAGAKQPPDDDSAAREGFEHSNCIDGCILATKYIAYVCYLQDKCMSGQQANQSWELSLDAVKLNIRISTTAS